MANVSSLLIREKLACFSLICECLAIIVLHLTVPLRMQARNRICHQINLCEPDQRESLWFLGGCISESCRHDTFVAHRFVNECNFFVDNTTRRVVLRLRIPFLRSIRVSRCFYSYHFSSPPRMNQDLWRFFRRERETRGVRRKYVVTNFVLSWEIKFTLRIIAIYMGWKRRKLKREGERETDARRREVSLICCMSEARTGIVVFSRKYETTFRVIYR